MPENKKWKGILVNHCMFQGEIVEDPVQNNGYFFMNLRTKIVNRDANGQYVESSLDVPLVVAPDGPTSVVQNHISAGRKLLAWCVYNNWQADGVVQHGFFIKNIDLGSKPYVGPQQSTPQMPG